MVCRVELAGLKGKWKEIMNERKRETRCCCCRRADWEILKENEKDVVGHGPVLERKIE